ncbi:MAG: serine/threonine protein kinase [Chlamydiales bacterium]|jgi:serine/threonine protein kinase
MIHLSGSEKKGGKQIGEGAYKTVKHALLMDFQAKTVSNIARGVIGKKRHHLPSHVSFPLSEFQQFLSKNRKSFENYGNVKKFLKMFPKNIDTQTLNDEVNTNKNKLIASNKKLPNLSEEDEFTLSAELDNFIQAKKEESSRDALRNTVKEEQDMIRQFEEKEGIVELPFLSEYTGKGGAVRQGLASKLYSQGDLVDFVTKGAEPEKKREVLLNALKGLEAIHEKGVVHRDIKWDNILIEDDKGYIGDFGLASTEEEMSDSRIMSGTMGYLPPEECRRADEPVLDPKKGDIYAMGVTLLETFRSDISNSHQFPPSFEMSYNKFVEISDNKMELVFDQYPTALFEKLKKRGYTRYDLMDVENDINKTNKTYMDFINKLKNEIRISDPADPNQIKIKKISSLIADCLDISPENRPDAATLRQRFEDIHTSS